MTLKARPKGVDGKRVNIPCIPLYTIAMGTEKARWATVVEVHEMHGRKSWVKSGSSLTLRYDVELLR